MIYWLHVRILVQSQLQVVHVPLLEDERVVLNNRVRNGSDAYILVLDHASGGEHCMGVLREQIEAVLLSDLGVVWRNNLKKLAERCLLVPQQRLVGGNVVIQDEVLGLDGKSAPPPLLSRLRYQYLVRLLVQVIYFLREYLRGLLDNGGSLAKIDVLNELLRNLNHELVYVRLYINLPRLR